MADSSGKRTISGYKTLDRAMRFTGKWGLKALAKGGELAVRGATTAIDHLANSEQFQVVATTGGLVAASVAFPPLGIGLGAFVAGKCLADKILNRSSRTGERTFSKALRDTILLANRATKLVCDRAISPAMRTVNRGAKDIGEKAQDGIDDMDLFK